MKYTKPEFLVTEFTPNEAISLCQDTTDIEWNNQTVQCVVNGTEAIFYSGCQNQVSDGSIKYLEAYSGDGFTIDEGYYYCWSASTTAKPDATQQKKIDYLMGQFGVSDGGWHVGPATAEIITVHNMS